MSFPEPAQDRPPWALRPPGLTGSLTVWVVESLYLIFKRCGFFVCFLPFCIKRGDGFCDPILIYRLCVMYMKIFIVALSRKTKLETTQMFLN